MPRATSRTPSGPLAVKNSRPSFTPPTLPARAATSRCARARSGVSMAQRIGLRVIASSLDSIIEAGLRTREILERMADRFEERNLIVKAPAGALAARKLEEIAGNVVRRDHARRHGRGNVARLAHRGLARIDEDARAPHRLVIGFAHLRRASADEVDVDARLQPFAFEDRLMRGGGAADDLRAMHGARQIVRRRDFEPAAIEPVPIISMRSHSG